MKSKFEGCVIVGKRYTLEQFPKHRDVIGLSEEQQEIRDNQIKVVHPETRICTKCKREHPITEFWFRDKKNNVRRRVCRDCKLAAIGIVEVGKCRYAKKILNKGFRRCSNCKDTLPLTEFVQHSRGIRWLCKNCTYVIKDGFKKRHVEKISECYLRVQARTRGVELIPEELEKIKQSILEKRKLKYFIDGESFSTVRKFGQYVEKKYGVPAGTVRNRIALGYSEEECKIRNLKKK